MRVCVFRSILDLERRRRRRRRKPLYYFSFLIFEPTYLRVLICNSERIINWNKRKPDGIIKKRKEKKRETGTVVVVVTTISLTTTSGLNQTFYNSPNLQE